MSSFVVELSYHPIVLPMTYSARGCVWWLFVVMGQSPLNSYLSHLHKFVFRCCRKVGEEGALRVIGTVEGSIIGRWVCGVMGL